MSGFPVVPIGSVAVPIQRSQTPVAGQIYRQVGVRLWGQGAYERESMDGGDTQYKTLNRVEFGDIIVNKIWARNGSVSVVLDDTTGCFASSEFPIFVPNLNVLEPLWFRYLTKTPDFWRQCAEKSFGTSGKNRIRPEKFLEIEIPLPPLNEQQRIVAYIDALTIELAEARGLRGHILADMRIALQEQFDTLKHDAIYIPMREVAPITRRSVEVFPENEYLELGIRSFGNGTFHKPPISGLELGDKRVFTVYPDDLLFSNVFAWEGAIAVAKADDEGRVASHRFISCVPQKGLATSHFLKFYFLTPEGLYKIREASPGGAGRNRTLGLEKLERIEVPVIDYEIQLEFDALQTQVAQLEQIESETDRELDSLLPSILDRAFRGEL